MSSATGGVGRRTVLTILLFVLAFGVNGVLSRDEVQPPRRLFVEFPQEIGQWHMAAGQAIDSETMAVLQVDDYLMRTYIDGNGNALGLYLGYFASQREGKQNHSPRQCLAGAGWQTVRSGQHFISLPGSKTATPVAVNFQLMGKDNQYELYLWWYQGRGRIITNEYLNKLYLVWDALLLNRTDGALVRLNMSVPGAQVEPALKTEERFLNLITPLLAEYIPN